MTFGCLTFLRILISLVTLSTSLLSLILSFSRIFIATFSPVIVWVPILTLPKVPDPRDLPETRNTLWRFKEEWLTNYIVANGATLDIISRYCLFCRLSRISGVLFSIIGWNPILLVGFREGRVHCRVCISYPHLIFYWNVPSSIDTFLLGCHSLFRRCLGTVLLIGLVCWRLVCHLRRAIILF